MSNKKTEELVSVEELISFEIVELDENTLDDVVGGMEVDPRLNITCPDTFCPNTICPDQICDIKPPG